MQAVTSTPQTRSLAQIVCEWQPSQLSEITERFSESSSAPQTTFPTYHSYKAYFEPLLFAELSAEFLSAVEKYQRASNSRQTKIRARREESGTTVALVAAQKVFKTKPPGFGWTVDVETTDRRGPVGCVDNDIVAVWSQAATDNPQHNRSASSSRQLPSSAVLCLVKSISRSGCRLVTSKFPDGNEDGQSIPEEDKKKSSSPGPGPRRWVILRVGSLTTVRREFDALQSIKNSTLLPVILRPRVQQSTNVDGTSDFSSNVTRKQGNDATTPKPLSELFFTKVVVDNTGLNPSQARAIIHASTTRAGFSVIQGPPGTGKTRTLIGLLNVVHMAHYQKYYEGLLASLEDLHGKVKEKQSEPKPIPDQDNDKKIESEKPTEASLLETMMDDMSKTVAVASDLNTLAFPKHVSRPRLLICAPSNSAVDEILTRLVRARFIDGQGSHYCPELARIGAGDRVSDAAKPFTAEGQAERFLDKVCGEEMSPEAREKAQRKYLTSWQNRCNTLLVQLSRTPKDKEASQSTVIQLHENLERLDRDMRRLRIAVADRKKGVSRDDKLRMIARTYVEDAQLVFATLSGSASGILTRKGSSDFFDDTQSALFDTVVIDEGAQATETSCLIPLALGASRCLLVGDPQQLPATVLSSGSAGLAYGQSLLERVHRAGQGVLLLDTQYRMHPAISSFPRRYFYNGKLADDESVQGEHRGRPYHRHALRPKFGPYVFLDISESREKRSRDDKSVFNPMEAELAASIYTKLKKEFPQDPLFSPAAKTPGSVAGFGVVTPYKRQMQELRQCFDRAGIPTGDVEIDTVDSYQGREKEFVVFSCVRTVSLNRGIGFVRDVRRMNVGLTRARASLIILGSAQALSEGSSDWAELIEDANSRGCLISVSNVSRCLEPAPPHSDPLVQNETRLLSIREGSAKGKHQELPASVSSTVGFARPGATGPTDPRKRFLQKRDRKEPCAKPKPIAVELANTANAPIALLQRAHDPQTVEPAPVQMVPSQTGQPLRHGVVPVQPSQPEIKQMTQVLSDAGFGNAKAVEATLADHVSRGGNLDIETVMAAAFVTNGSRPIEAIEEEKSEPEVPVQQGHISIGNDSAEIAAQVNADSSTGKTVPAGVEHYPVPITPVDAQVGYNNDFVRQNRRDASTTKGARSDKRIVKEKFKKTKESTAPSGWDLLFSKSKDGSGAPVKKEKATDVDQSTAKEESVKEPDEGDNVGVSNQRKPNNPSVGDPYRSMDSSYNNEADDGEWNSHAFRREPVSYGEYAGRPWNDRGRGGRKRPRGHESYRSRGRGYERGRSRGKRGRTERFNPDRGNPAYGSQTSWRGNGQYAPNVNNYPVMNVLDPSLAAAHPGIMSLPPAQQQVLQQQLMQQQLIQQQVLQQQAIQQQHQALQQQQVMQPHAVLQQHQVMNPHQALQQHAMQQQEALRQQAVFMQLSAAGINSNPVNAPVYPVNEFNGFVGGMTGNEMPGGFVNQEQWTQDSWGREKNIQNGYGGRGRGRGRYRGYGRGNRWR